MNEDLMEGLDAAIDLLTLLAIVSAQAEIVTTEIKAAREAGRAVDLEKLRMARMMAREAALG